MAGEMVHFELIVKDADKAQAFWSGRVRLGLRAYDAGRWTTGMAQIDDKIGSRDLRPRTKARGIRNVYLATDDIEASIAKVRELGGRSRRQVPCANTRLVSPACKDNQGIAFHLWAGPTRLQPDAAAAVRVSGRVGERYISRSVFRWLAGSRGRGFRVRADVAARQPNQHRRRRLAFATLFTAVASFIILIIARRKALSAYVDAFHQPWWILMGGLMGPADRVSRSRTQGRASATATDGSGSSSPASLVMGRGDRPLGALRFGQGSHSTGRVSPEIVLLGIGARTLAERTDRWPSNATNERPAPGSRSSCSALACSVQGGAAVAKSLFPELGPPRAVVFLRLLFGGPRVVGDRATARSAARSRARSPARVRPRHGCSSRMNLCFYEAVARLPLGIAGGTVGVSSGRSAARGSRCRAGRSTSSGSRWPAEGGSHSSRERRRQRAVNTTGIVLAADRQASSGRSNILLSVRVGPSLARADGPSLRRMVGPAE